MFENCTENGYLFSCFKNFGRIKNSDDCKKVCDLNNLSQFGLNDFFNFHDRLNQSNFLIKARGTQYDRFNIDMCRCICSPIERKRKYGKQSDIRCGGSKT